MSFGVFNIGPGQPHRSQLVEATISSSKPAPRSFGDPLYVVPKWNEARATVWAITDWFAVNGATLPEQGADCLVLWSDYRRLSVVWWDGAYTAPSASAVGALAKASNLSDLPSRSTAVTNLGIARGMSSISFSSAGASSTTTVTHGLASAPTSVIATVNEAVGFNQLVTVFSTAYGASTFELWGMAPNLTGAATFGVSWIAIL